MLERFALLLEQGYNRTSDEYGYIVFDTQHNTFKPMSSNIESQINSTQASDMLNIIFTMHLTSDNTSINESENTIIFSYGNELLDNLVCTIKVNLLTKFITVKEVRTNVIATFSFNNITKSNRFVELLEIIDNNRTK